MLPLRSALGLISVCALASTIVVGRPAGADAAPCEAWPGEPSPLPHVDAEDAVLARWARLRADELAKLAAPLEPVAHGDAHRLWRHVACLDPQNARALDALARTAPGRLHQPPLVLAPSRDRLSPRADIGVSLAVLDEPVQVAPRGVAAMPAAPPSPAVAAPPPTPDFGAVDAILGEADALLREARFEEALARLDAARTSLPRRGVAGASGRRARLEALAGTAQVALGRDGEARASFAAALRADPRFRLDAKSTSPKVMRVFDAARDQGAR